MNANGLINKYFIILLSNWKPKKEHLNKIAIFPLNNIKLVFFLKIVLTMK
ncbi:hypothetical protein M8044_000382 [Columbia Basin potato purple top phytoplasma]|uniref:Uncharacterized protein n=1 Tax=Columbia Basin potato purple top phytoplasma TaxID=307134 RepID=A0ABT5L987_9MOLU|nr:hypothetical protein [Columbia Basin potato purple top phytoplasma]